MVGADEGGSSFSSLFVIVYHPLSGGLAIESNASNLPATPECGVSKL